MKLMTELVTKFNNLSGSEQAAAQQEGWRGGVFVGIAPPVYVAPPVFCPPPVYYYPAPYEYGY